jgi:hypothetical protein
MNASNSSFFQFDVPDSRTILFERFWKYFFDALNLMGKFILAYSKSRKHNKHKLFGVECKYRYLDKSIQEVLVYLS